MPVEEGLSSHDRFASLFDQGAQMSQFELESSEITPELQRVSS